MDQVAVGSVAGSSSRQRDHDLPVLVGIDQFQTQRLVLDVRPFATLPRFEVANRPEHPQLRLPSLDRRGQPLPVPGLRRSPLGSQPLQHRRIPRGDHCLPDLLQVRTTQLLCLGHPADSLRIGREHLAVCQGRLEVPRHVDPSIRPNVTGVAGLDPGHQRITPVTTSGAAVEPKSIREQHGVSSDALGGVQVLVQQCR